MKEYRKLDDSITMRLNRANAAVRDQERDHGGPRPGKGNVQDQACSFLWHELIGKIHLILMISKHRMLRKCDQETGIVERSWLSIVLP